LGDPQCSDDDMVVLLLDNVRESVRIPPNADRMRLSAEREHHLSEWSLWRAGRTRPLR
jgi:hypothetical protein